MAESNFVATVKAAGASDNFTQIVKVANPEDFANALPVTELPTAGESYRDVLLRLTTTNIIYYLNTAGDGWTALESGEAGSGDVVGPSSHAASYVPQWNTTADSKTLVEGFAITAAGKAILDDAAASDQRLTLGVVDASDNMTLPILLPADKRVSCTIKTLTDDTTVTPDMATGNIFKLTLGGNRTIANPDNVVAGQSFVLYMIQDATGSRVPSWGSYYCFASSDVCLI
jgi:hypothetical protein